MKNSNQAIATPEQIDDRIILGGVMQSWDHSMQRKWDEASITISIVSADGSIHLKHNGVLSMDLILPRGTVIARPGTAFKITIERVS